MAFLLTALISQVLAFITAYLASGELTDEAKNKDGSLTVYGKRARRLVWLTFVISAVGLAVQGYQATSDARTQAAAQASLQSKLSDTASELRTARDALRRLELPFQPLALNMVLKLPKNYNEVVNEHKSRIAKDRTSLDVRGMKAPCNVWITVLIRRNGMNPAVDGLPVNKAQFGRHKPIQEPADLALHADIAFDPGTVHHSADYTRQWISYDCGLGDESGDFCLNAYDLPLVVQFQSPEITSLHDLEGSLVEVVGSSFPGLEIKLRSLSLMTENKARLTIPLEQVMPVRLDEQSSQLCLVKLTDDVKWTSRW